MELDMSKADYLSRMNSQFDKLTVGAAVIRFTSSNIPQVLLLQRKLDESYYPGVYEIPGGKVDDTDATIADAIIREVKEESNLTITQIVTALPEITYTTEKKVTGKSGSEESVIKHAIQLSYVVQVEDATQLHWNPEEHCNGIWASPSDLKGIAITDKMRSLIESAFESARKSPMPEVFEKCVDKDRL
ncbi:NTP pyrophosphohydrolase [Seiridium cupressi]